MHFLEVVWVSDRFLIQRIQKNREGVAPIIGALVAIDRADSYQSVV